MFLENLYKTQPTVKFCEEISDFVIKRPFYALSNLGYLFVGLIILRDNNKLSKSFGWTIIAVGLFSLIYDSTYSYLFQLLDLTGMLIFINLLLFINIKDIFPLKNRNIVITKVFLIIISVVLIYFIKGNSGNIIFGLFVLATLIAELYLYIRRRFGGYKFFWIGFGLFLIGFVIWIFDFQKIYCDPNNIVNGRGVFHILTAIAVYYLYKFYNLRSEE